MTRRPPMAPELRTELAAARPVIARLLRPIQLGLPAILAVALTACGGGQVSSSSPPFVSVAPTLNVASAADAIEPSASRSISASTPSFQAAPKTLRTIAEAADTPTKLSVGREMYANEQYASHLATYTSDGLTISAVLLEPRSPGRHPGVVLVHGFVDPAAYKTGGELTREQAYLVRAATSCSTRTSVALGSRTQPLAGRQISTWVRRTMSSTPCARSPARAAKVSTASGLGCSVIHSAVCWRSMF